MAAYTNPRRRQWNVADDCTFLTSDDCSVSPLMQNLRITNDDKNFCLLDRLADIPEMAHIVISMLDYYELVKLACVNKKWYKTVVNAPQSVKPLVRASVLFVQKGRIAVDVGLINYCINPSLENFFNMIKCIEHRTCWFINETVEGPYKNTVEPLQFLLDHRNDFLITKVEFAYPTSAKIDYTLLSGLFSSFNNFDLTFGYFVIKMPDLWRQELQKVVLENLSLESLMFYFQLDVEFLKDLLVQVANGQRPNFRLIIAGLENRADFIQIARGIGKSQLRRINKNKFKIKIPSLDKRFVVEQYETQGDRPVEWWLEMRYSDVKSFKWAPVYVFV